MTTNLLLTNPDFELGNASGWEVGGGTSPPTLTADASAAHDGGYGGLLVGAGAGGAAQYAQTAVANRLDIDVFAGYQYNFSMWAKLSSLLGIQVFAMFYDGAGTLVQQLLIFNGQISTSWVNILYIFSAFAGATKLGIRFQPQLGSGNTAYLDTAILWQNPRNPTVQGVQSIQGIQSITF